MLGRLLEGFLGPIKAKSTIFPRNLQKFAIPSNVVARKHLNEALIFRGSLNSTKSIQFDCPIKKVVGGIDHIMFLLSNGRIYGIGSNTFGQLGIDVNKAVDLWTALRVDEDADEQYEEPQSLDTLDGHQQTIAEDIAAGHFTTFAISKHDRRLYAWGSGILGSGNEHYDTRPQSIRIKDVVNVEAWKDLCLVKTKSNTKFLFGATMESNYKALQPLKCNIDHLPESTDEYPNTPILYLTHTLTDNPEDIISTTSFSSLSSQSSNAYHNYNYAVFY